MSAERGRQVDKIFHEALDREPHERAKFIERACTGDASLRSEVEALIRSQEQAGSSLGAPALAVAGQMIGSYQVKTLIGSGGMGEVYRA